MEGSGSKKLVFFYEKYEAVSGALIFYMRIAQFIAHNSDYEVFYVNYKNKVLEEMYSDSKLQFCDLTKCDFSEFENADFIVPINYLFFLLERTKDIQTGKILLFDWHPELVKHLSFHFGDWNRDMKSLLSLFREKQAAAFMDSSCLLSANRWMQEPFPENYVPVFLSEEEQPCAGRELVNETYINIGWLGRLDGDKIYALINLLDMLKLSDIDRTINIHIIGDGAARSKIKLEAYAPQMRFTFTSYLLGEERDQYILEHIDLMVAMGISALDVSNLSIPTVIPITRSRRFINNQFVFLFDTVGGSLGWSKEDLLLLGCKTRTIAEVVEMVYAPGGKRRLGEMCWQYCHENFNIENSGRKMLEALEKTQLTLEDCRSHPMIAQQMDSFHRYQKIRKRYNRNYGDYILFVQKMNRLRRMSIWKKCKVLWNYVSAPIKKAFAKGKKRLWTIVDKTKRRIRSRRLYKRTQDAYPAKIAALQLYAKEHTQLRAAFLVIFSSVFPSEPIFEKMLEDPVFDPYIIVIPDMQRSLRHKISTYKETYEDLFQKYGDRVLNGLDVNANVYLELKEDYQLVFFNNPYSKMAFKFHHVTYFLNKNVLPLYVNYGFAAIKFGRNIMKTDFYNLLWKVCIDSEINLQDLKEHQPIKGHNALVTGYVKMDRLANVSVRPRDRKKIIICPHHTVLGWKSLDISNFMTYYEFFLELPTIYPEIDFVFRPHPLLFSNLLENRVWNQERINDYLSQIEALPNMVYDHSGDYMDLFANSDAMIHDCSSFIGEYLFTEKPCCYMLKSQQEIEDVLNPMGMACIKNYYKAFSKEDIMKFIDDVVVSGIDPLKEGREKFSRQELKFNYPMAADCVLDVIKNTLLIDGRTE